VREFLLVCRAADDLPSQALSEDLAKKASAQGLVVSALNPRAWLALPSSSPATPVRVGGWTLIGDIFDRRSPVIPYAHPDDPWGYERKLMARFWGRYVGALFGAGDQLSALLRDPSGALECVAWSEKGLTIVAPTAFEWLIKALRPAWRINSARLAQELHAVVTGTGALLIDGPTALEPGTVQPLPLERQALAVWTPADIARRSLWTSPDPHSAMEAIRSSIDEAVSGFASLPGALAAEVSGGLDSSIIASSLVRQKPDGQRLWINAYGSTPESDERAHVAILGQSLGFKPLSVPHVTGRMTPDWLAAMAGDFRPGLNGLDHPQDVAWARHVVDGGASALMTGKGGDSILFQAATTDVFTDLWKSRGWRALGHPDLAELAAGNEISIWSMIRTAVRYSAAGQTPPRRAHPILSPLTEPFVGHPWLQDLDAFGPGKAFHIAGVADSVSHHGPSVLSRAVDVRHPLCSQPVVEACLALPTALLTAGGRDRGLARQAFREGLPDTIVNRRSKGEMTRIYGRLIVDNLDILRPWLIDGRLAALGLIDRATAETELTPEALIWRGQHSVILGIAALEGWTRLWEDRLGRAA